jgi:hypothetical protein
MGEDSATNWFWNFRDFENAYVDECHLMDFNAVVLCTVTNCIRIFTEGAIEPYDDPLYQVSDQLNLYGSESYSLKMIIEALTDVYCEVQDTGGRVRLPGRALLVFSC